MWNHAQQIEETEKANETIYLARSRWIDLGSVAFAQDSPKVEITGYYSYFRLTLRIAGLLAVIR